MMAGEIKAQVLAFCDRLASDSHHRYRSWEHRFAHFRQHSTFTTKHIDTPLSIWRSTLPAGACIEGRAPCSGRMTGFTSKRWPRCSTRHIRAFIEV
jgi:hypothetical protein